MVLKYDTWLDTKSVSRVVHQILQHISFAYINSGIFIWIFSYNLFPIIFITFSKCWFSMQNYKHILSHEFSYPGTTNVTLHQKVEIRKGLFLLHVEKATKNDRNIFASCIQRFFLFLIVFCSILSLWHFLPLCLHTIISIVCRL